MRMRLKQKRISITSNWQKIPFTVANLSFGHFHLNRGKPPQKGGFVIGDWFPSSYRSSGRLKLESFYDCLNLKVWPKKTQNASKRFIETNKHPRKRLNFENINDRDDLLLDLGSQSLSYACARYSRITNCGNLYSLPFRQDTRLQAPSGNDHCNQFKRDQFYQSKS